MPERSPLLPALAAVAAAVLGGSAVVATRFAVPESDALSLATARHAGAGLIMVLVAATQRRLRFERLDLLTIIGLGILQFGLFGWCFTAALKYVPAARGALVLSTMPVLTLAIAVIAGRERPTLGKIAGAAIAALGVFVALGERAAAAGPEVWKGDVLMFAAALLGSLYNVLSSLSLKRYRALAVIAVQIPSGTVALLVALALGGDFSGLVAFSAAGWIAVVYLMTVAGAFCFYLWIWALEHTAPSRVAIAVTANPVASTILGALILAEPVTWRIFVGLVGVIAGIVLVNWPTRAPPPSETRP
jgi:drug/metabolite transporter (DMT)-like permease